MIIIEKTSEHTNPQKFRFGNASWVCYNCGVKIQLKGGHLTDVICSRCGIDVATLAELTENGAQGMMEYYFLGWAEHDEEMAAIYEESKPATVSERIRR